MGLGLSKEAFPTRRSDHEPMFQRLRKPTDTIYVEDVLDWIDGTDCHCVFVKMVRKGGEEVWGSIPDVKAALDVAVAAMKKYEDAVEEFLDGTEADNEADKEMATPVTLATMEELRKVADPMIDAVAELREAIERDKNRLVEEAKESNAAFEDGIDTCLFWSIVFMGGVLFTWWFLASLHETAVQVAYDNLIVGNGTLGVTPETAAIEDEM